MQMNTNNLNSNNHEDKSNRKWIDRLLLPIFVTVVAGIILLPVEDIYDKLFRTAPSPTPPIETNDPPVPTTTTPPIEGFEDNVSETTPSIEGFEDNVSDYSNGKIKYSSPEYEIDVILPDGCLCKKYLPASQNSQEEIELQYDSDLKIGITIGEMPYEGFNSLEEYSEYYYEIYNQCPNFYKSFNFKKSIPYCVFSFNTDNGQGIYYELIYNLNGIYCATKFIYPTNKRGVYNEIVTDYCSYVRTQE